MRLVGECGAVDEDRDVMAYAAVLVEHVAAQIGIAREHLAERLGERRALCLQRDFARTARIGQMSCQRRSEYDFRHCSQLEVRKGTFCSAGRRRSIANK